MMKEFSPVSWFKTKNSERERVENRDKSGFVHGTVVLHVLGSFGDYGKNKQR